MYMYSLVGSFLWYIQEGLIVIAPCSAAVEHISLTWHEAKVLVQTY